MLPETRRVLRDAADAEPVMAVVHHRADCPRCGDLMGLPDNWAVSRTDGETPVCRSCGRKERDEVLYAKLTPKRKWVGA